MISPLGIRQSEDNHDVFVRPSSESDFLSFLLITRCVEEMIFPIKTFGPGVTLMTTLICFAVVSTCSSDEI